MKSTTISVGCVQLEDAAKADCNLVPLSCCHLTPCNTAFSAQNERFVESLRRQVQTLQEQRPAIEAEAQRKVRSTMNLLIESNTGIFLCVEALPASEGHPEKKVGLHIPSPSKQSELTAVVCVPCSLDRQAQVTVRSMASELAAARDQSRQVLEQMVSRGIYALQPYLNTVKSLKF